MPTYKYTVHIHTDIFPQDHVVDDLLWYSALSNIYGIPSSNFDGYVKNIKYDDRLITIDCYVVDGPDEREKYDTIRKDKRDDSQFYIMKCVGNALLSQARTLNFPATHYELIELSNIPN